MAFTSLFCTCFDGESQLRFTIRFSFRTELGSIVHHVLKNAGAEEEVPELDKNINSSAKTQKSHVSSADPRTSGEEAQDLEMLMGAGQKKRPPPQRLRLRNRRRGKKKLKR